MQNSYMVSSVILVNKSNKSKNIIKKGTLPCEALMDFHEMTLLAHTNVSVTISFRKNLWCQQAWQLDVAGNYPGHSKYKASLWLCQACNLEVKEDQEHLTVCEGYQDLRGDADLDNEEELVE